MLHVGNKGFTLLEMTIVMVVLAVLAGATLVGRDLMYAAELRATAQQIDMLNSAYAAFRLKYDCTPGDCNNASALGFTAGFTIDLALNQFPAPEENTNPFSLVSSAYAFSPVPIGPGLVPTIPIVTVDGNNNDSLERGNYENFISLALLDQANMIKDFDDRVRVPVKLSTAMGQTNSGVEKKAFWMTYYLVPSADSLISAPGHYFFAIATAFPTIGAATFPPHHAYWLDGRLDDGFPPTGIMRASSDRGLNDVNGPKFDPIRDAGADFCLAADASGQIVYNVLKTLARCAVVVKASTI